MGLSVDATTGSRFDLAMERFRSGNSFEFGGVAFSIDQGGVVRCIVETSWEADKVTAGTANCDLDEGEAAFRFLMNESTQFRAAVTGRPISYELAEDYGMGSISICSRRDGILEWSHGFPRSGG